jgi:hypothetical protein
MKATQHRSGAYPEPPADPMAGSWWRARPNEVGRVGK